MYNRYIPQPDGSYRRSRIQDFHPQQRSTDGSRNSGHTHPEPAPPEPPCQEPEPCPCPPPRVPPCPRSGSCRSRQGRRPSGRSESQEHCPPPQEGSVGGFLRNLLPKDFDTGDLLIILLLLLMAGDCPEDQNNALLTLALYFFM